MSSSRLIWMGMVAGLLAGSAQAGALQSGFTLPLANINNPCTSGFDGINGSVDVHAVAQEANGVKFVRFNAQGSATDANGLRYRLGGTYKIQIHDPFPAWCYLKLKMVSQTAVDNAFLVAAVHVNENGVITKAEFSGVECKG